MANTHRTKRLRTTDWEVFDLFDREYRLVGNTVPSLFSRISARVKGGLINASAIEFLRSKVRFEQDDENWTVQRYLGGGAYGTAAIWVKTNSGGEVLDELVIKEQREHHKHGLWQRNLEDLPREAVLQQVLNQSRCENIVQLRGFKAYNTPTRRWRFYMEYAPYGNLNILRWRYRAFNRYLPELFLWHLFNSLAQAVEAMEKDALTGDTIGSLQRHKNDFILHLDIKPENIFLGYEETHAERRPEAPWRTGGLVEPLYPSVKMGDFGLAQYSYEGDDQDVPEPAENPRGLLWQGTPGFKAPEQICYDCNWFTPQINHEDKITGKLNVWNIGKVMFDLCCLAQPHEYERNMRAQTEQQFQANGNDTLPDFDQRPFATDKLCKRSPYSKELTDLIGYCMRIRPDDRPTAHQLALDTKAILLRKHSDAESRTPHNVRNRKLYYRGNEINYMTRREKNCDLPNSAYDYLSLLRPENNDPDAPPLDLDPVRLMFHRDERDWGYTSEGDYYRRLIGENLHAKAIEKERYAWQHRLLNGGTVRIENGKIVFLREHDELRRIPIDLTHDSDDDDDDDDDEQQVRSPDVNAHPNQRPGGPQIPNPEQPQYLLKNPHRPTHFPNAKALFCADQRERLRAAGYPYPHIEERAEDLWNNASPTIVRSWNDHFVHYQRRYPLDLMVYEAFDIYHGQRYDQHYLDGFSNADIVNIVLDEWNALTNADREGYVRQHIKNLAPQQYANHRRRGILGEQPTLTEAEIEIQIQNEWAQMDEQRRVQLEYEYAQQLYGNRPVAVAPETSPENVVNIDDIPEHSGSNIHDEARALYDDDRQRSLRAQGLPPSMVDIQLANEWSYASEQIRQKYIQTARDRRGVEQRRMREESFHSAAEMPVELRGSSLEHEHGGKGGGNTANADSKGRKRKRDADPEGGGAEEGQEQS